MILASAQEAHSLALKETCVGRGSSTAEGKRTVFQNVQRRKPHMSIRSVDIMRQHFG